MKQTNTIDNNYVSLNNETEDSDMASNKQDNVIKDLL